MDENGGFTHWKWWFSIAMLVITGGYPCMASKSSGWSSPHGRASIATICAGFMHVLITYPVKTTIVHDNSWYYSWSKPMTCPMISHEQPFFFWVSLNLPFLTLAPQKKNGCRQPPQVPWVCCASVWATSLVAPILCCWQPWVLWQVLRENHLEIWCLKMVDTLEDEAATL